MKKMHVQTIWTGSEIATENSSWSLRVEPKTQRLLKPVLGTRKEFQSIVSYVDFSHLFMIRYVIALIFLSPFETSENLK
jgi:hypothetical protein